MSLINEIVKDAPKAIAVVCDVGKEKDIESMVDQAVSEFGRLDIVFNNAGISQPYFSHLTYRMMLKQLIICAPCSAPSGR